MENTAKKINQEDNLVTLPQSGLVLRLREMMVAKGITNRALAAKIGISQAALSQWFNGSYKGSLSALEAKAEKWLATERERRKGTAKATVLPDYVPTATSQRIMSTLAFAQGMHEFVIAYGAAGVGKTQAAKEYARNHSNVWLITITPATAAMISVLQRIAGAVSAKSSSRSCAAVEANVLERLKDADGLLIIDEAQHLKINVLEQLRSLFDATNVGLALLGNETVYSRLAGGFQAAAFAQLFSRISKRMHLRGASESDVSALARAMGVSGTSELAFLKKIAARSVALRGVAQTVRLASILAVGETIKVSHLKQAWRELTETDI